MSEDEPGQERSEFENERPSADQDGMQAIEEPDQVEVQGEEPEFPGAFAGEEPTDAEYTESGPTDAESHRGEPAEGGSIETESADVQARDVEPEKEETVEEAPVASALDIEGLPAPEPIVVRTVEALLFLAPDPLSPQELADAVAVEELGVIAALAELAETVCAGTQRHPSARARRRVHLRERSRDRGRRKATVQPPAGLGPHAGPGGDAWRLWPTCSRCRGRRSLASAA